MTAIQEDIDGEVNLTPSRLSSSTISGAPHFPIVNSLGEKIYGLGSVWSVQSSNDGDWIATNGSLGTFVWKNAGERWNPVYWFECDLWRYSCNALSRDGRFIAAPVRDVMLLCRLSDGFVIKRIPNCRKGVFSPDGKYLAAAHDNTVDLIDTDNGRLVISYPLSNLVDFPEMFFSSDSKEILITPQYDLAVHFRIDSKEALQQYGPVQGRIVQARFFDGNEKIAVISQRPPNAHVDNNHNCQQYDATVFDAFSSKKVRSIKTPKNITAYALDAKRQTFIGGGGGDSLHYWELTPNGGYETKRVYQGYIRSIGINEEDSLIAIGASRGVVKIINSEDRQIVRELSVQGMRYWNDVTLIGQNRVLLIDRASQVALYNWKSGEILHEFEGYLNDVVDVCLSPENDCFATVERVRNPFSIGWGECLNKAKTRIWNVETGDSEGAYASAFSHGMRKNLIAFHPGGNTLLIPDRGPVVKTIDVHNPFIRGATFPIEKREGSCSDGYAPWRIEGSVEGDSLIVDSSVMDWSLEKTIYKASDYFEEILSTKDGYWSLFQEGVSRSSRGNEEPGDLHLRFLNTNREIVLLSDGAYRRHESVLSANGGYLAIVMENNSKRQKKVVLWDLQNKKVILTRSEEDIAPMAIDPTEEWFFVKTNTEIKIYHIPTRMLRRSLSIYGCSNIEISRDGKQMLASSVYGYIKYWNDLDELLKN